MIEEVKDTVGNNAKYSVADAGYFSGEEIARSEELREQTDVYVDIPENYNTNAGKKSDDKYHVNNFTYDINRDVFLCPHGTVLKRCYQRPNNVVMYR